MHLWIQGVAIKHYSSSDSKKEQKGAIKVITLLTSPSIFTYHLNTTHSVIHTLNSSIDSER